MNAQHPPRIVAAAALVVGALLGMTGTFVTSAEIRSLAWGIDGALLVVASALLTAHHLRQGQEQLAAGFLVFMGGETLVVSSAAVELVASTPTFAAGAALWSAGMLLVSAPPVQPMFVRVTGVIAATLLGATAVAMFAGASLTPLSRPLPFFAYPFLALTLFGWAWTHLKRPRSA